MDSSIRQWVLVGAIGLLAAAAATDVHAQTAPKLGGYVQVRESITSGTGFSATLNRVRLSADGGLAHRIGYRLLIEYQAGAVGRTPAGVSLRDAYVKWSPAPFAVTAGQFKTPFSREYLTSITAIEAPDRPAAIDTLAPKRDIGVMAEWTPSALATFAIGAFNGEGQNASGNRDSTLLWVGRIVVRPFAPLTLAAHGATWEGDSTRWGGEIAIERRGALVRAELLGQRIDGRDRDDLGWFVLAGYRVAPWLQLIARQEDLQRPAVGEARRVSATTAGANFDLPGGQTRIAAFFVSQRVGLPRETRNRGIVQLQVKF